MASHGCPRSSGPAPRGVVDGEHQPLHRRREASPLVSGARDARPHLNTNTRLSLVHTLIRPAPYTPRTHLQSRACCPAAPQTPKGALVGTLEGLKLGPGQMVEVEVAGKTILLAHTTTGKVFATTSKCT